MTARSLAHMEPSDDQQKLADSAARKFTVWFFGFLVISNLLLVVLFWPRRGTDRLSQPPATNVPSAVLTNGAR